MSPTRTALKNVGVVKPWVKNALSSKLLYADGEPKWPDSPSQSEAVDERQKLSRFLVKHAFVKQELSCIAQKLKYCSANSRCHCAACPECGRALQRFFVSECQPLFARKSVCVASIIDSKMSCQKDISQLSLSGLINRVRTLLRRNGVNLAAGGIDFSFNQDGIVAFQSTGVLISG